MLPKETPTRNLVGLALSYCLNLDNAGSAVNDNAGNGSHCRQLPAVPGVAGALGVGGVRTVRLSEPALAVHRAMSRFRSEGRLGRLLLLEDSRILLPFDLPLL